MSVTISFHRPITTEVTSMESGTIRLTTKDSLGGATADLYFHNDAEWAKFMDACEAFDRTRQQVDDLCRIDAIVEDTIVDIKTSPATNPLGSTDNPTVYAICPDTVSADHHYLTAGKAYEVRNAEEFGFQITDDEGDTISPLWEDCPHANGGDWTTTTEPSDGQ